MPDQKTLPHSISALASLGTSALRGAKTPDRHGASVRADDELEEVTSTDPTEVNGREIETETEAKSTSGVPDSTPDAAAETAVDGDGVETAPDASGDKVTLMALGLGGVALVAAAMGGSSKTQGHSDSGVPEPSHPASPSNPNVDSKPIIHGGVVNGSGSVAVEGLTPGAAWQFSTDGGKTWKPGAGNTISAGDLGEGANSIAVRQTDAAGNTSTSTIDVVKDSQVAQPNIGTSTGTGAINNSGSVNVGGLESGGKWDYSLDGGQTWTPGSGNAIAGTALNEGTNHVTVRQTDAAGNQSTQTADVVKDTQIAKPSIGTSTGTGAINNSGSVNVGGIESGGKWDYSLDGGQTWTPGSGSAIAGTALSEGTNHVTVRETDLAGNQSTQTADVVKDTQIAKPSIGTSTGTGAINNSGSVNVDGLESGGKWDYSLDGGQTWTPGSGSAIAGTALSEGTNHVTVRETDLAGNQSTQTADVVKDTQIAKPSIGTSTGTGAINNSGSVNVDGLESGGKWDYCLDGGQTWTLGSGSAIAGTALSEGTNHVTVRETDLAGNQSTQTADVVKDTQIAKPSIGTSTGTGAINNSGSVNVDGLESGGKWDYSLDGGQTWTLGSGSAIAGTALHGGTNHVTVRQTDLAGNQSTQTADVVKDTQIAKPSIGTSTGTGAINNSGSVNVDGLESGGKWDYSLDGGQTWTLGSGSAIAGTALHGGTNHVTVRQTDFAGNQSATTTDVVLDNTPAHATFSPESGAVGISAQSDEAGRFYVVNQGSLHRDSVAGIEALSSQYVSRLDVAAGQTVSFNSLPQLVDGAYEVMFADRAGNLAYANPTADTQSKLTVVGGQPKWFADYAVSGGAGDDTLVAVNGGGTLIGRAGHDQFVWLKGQTGTYTLSDFEDGESIDFTSFLPAGTTVTPSLSIQATRVNGVATILFDADGQGDFVHPEITIHLSQSASSAIVIMGGAAVHENFPPAGV